MLEAFIKRTNKQISKFGDKVENNKKKVRELGNIEEVRKSYEDL